MVVPAAAADKPCTPADKAAAEKAIDGVTAWVAFDKSFRDFGHCDTGNVATLFTEAMMRVLIDGWPTVGVGDEVLVQNPAFREWLMKRLRSPELNKDDSAAIRDLAKQSCPKGHDKVCAELLSAVESGRQISSPDLLQWPSAPASPAPPKDAAK